MADSNRWRLPVIRLAHNESKPRQWQTNGSIHGVSFTLRGPFPPDAAIQLTPRIGLMTSSWTVILESVKGGNEQSLAVGIRDEQGRLAWGMGSRVFNPQGTFLSYDFELPQSLRQAAIEVVLLEPACQAEFVVDTAAEWRRRMGK